MSDEQKPSSGGVPPKLDLRKSGIVQGAPSGEQPAEEGSAAGTPAPVPGGQQLKKQTTRVDLTAVQPEPPGAGKKKTSRISLTEAGVPAAPVVPKTIRLTPPPSAVRPLTGLAAMQAAKPAAPAGETPDRPKSQTSRIPLEAALAADEQNAGAPTLAAEPLTTAVPKTIRIKRPGQGPTVKLTKPEGETAPGAEKSKTSRVDIAAATVTEAPQATQRKTIKIRRPEGAAARPAARTVTVARTEAETTQTEPEVAVGGPGVTFVIATAAALLVACVMIYILMVQAFPGMNLSFPGKVTL